MPDWTDKILSKMLPDHQRHIIVIDENRLLMHEKIRDKLKERGCEIITAQSNLEARIRFELKIRNTPDLKLLVVHFSYHPLPDIKLAAYVIRIGYDDLFPYFDSKALMGLSYNALCKLEILKPYSLLGYNQTILFIMEQLYHIDMKGLIESITRERVLDALIRVIFHADGFSKEIIQYLQVLGKPIIKDITTITSSQDTFRNYLQDELKKEIDTKKNYINFSDSMLSKSLSFLLMNKILNPIKVSQEQYDLLPRQCHQGVIVDKNKDNQNRFNTLVKHLTNEMDHLDKQHMKWLNLSPLLGESYYLSILLGDSISRNEMDNLVQQLNYQFQKFIRYSYWQLFSLSGFRYPVMITRILEYMKVKASPKKALIVIDGMNLWQWHIIYEKLIQQNIKVNQMATFAYLPSITAYSRQALLKGSKPDLDKDNSREEILFREYWTKMGLGNSQVHFSPFGVDISSLDLSPSIDILALICNDLDKLMHGAVMGNEQLLIDTEQWIEKSKFIDTIQELRARGYQCFITTDHGNIEGTATTHLTLSERNRSISRSKRHINFTNKKDAEKFRDQHPSLSIGINNSAVYLTDKSAFINKGTIITHGGSHILELIIPMGVIG